ncbi:dynein axonemal intermediate chain 7 [Pelodytes ibericus]
MTFNTDFSKKKSSKGTSAASKKKARPSKAERLRLQKEEEERSHQEEEAVRLLAEQLEAQRLDKERLEKEERERLEAKQLEHRDEELEEYQSLLEKKLEEAGRWKRDLRIRAKWDRYLRCDGSPDPTLLPEINTFKGVWTGEKNEEFQSVLYRSSLVLELIRELEFLILDTPPEEITERDLAQYRLTLLELQLLLHQKFNDATEHLLKNATMLSDIDTGNMQKVIKNENVILCVWANLTKNPRFKGYDFAEEAIRFDLPKPLAVSSVAVRILHTAFDHLSCQSRTFLPRVKEVEEFVAVAEVRDVLESHLGEFEPAAEEHNVRESVIVADEEAKAGDRKSLRSASSAREDVRSITESRDNTGLESERKADSQLDDVFEGDSPSPILNGEQIDDSLEEDVVDLRQYCSLGGVYYFNVITMPPQSKHVKGWTMVQLLDGGLQMHPYPQASSLTSLPANMGVSLQEKDLEGLTMPPVGVSLKVPNNVIFFEEPQVARWDPEDKNWKMDVVTDKRYNPELRELSFKMDSFHTFTLLQDSHLNMPYESWELRPNGTNQVSLSITSAFTDIQLEVKDGQCRLASASNTDSDLSHIIGKWQTPLTLKSAMRGAGLNIFPEEDSARYVIVNRKQEAVERMAYKEMALLCASFAFGWSKWNHNCGFDHIIIKVKESILPELSNEDGWSLYMLNPERRQRLKISESAECFSDVLYTNSEFHSTLYHMIKDYASADATENLRHSHHLFMDCVHQLLNMTRVLTYS